MSDERGSAAVGVLATILGLLVLVGIVIGGYQLGWWLREQEVNRGAEIRRGSFEYQETRRDEVVRQAGMLSDLDSQISNPDLTNEQRVSLQAQRRAAARQLCNIAADLVGETTPEVQSIITREC